MPVVMNVKRHEPHGVFEVGRFTRETFNPGALRIPADSTGKLVIRYFAGSKIVGNLTIYVDPSQRPASPAPLPYSPARVAPEPAPAATPAASDAIVQSLLQELREMRRAMLESASRRPNISAGGFKLEELRELIAPKSALRELGEQLAIMRELGIGGGPAEEPWKGKLIDALAAPVANVVVEMLREESKKKAAEPAAQLPAKAEPTPEASPAIASPATDAPEVAESLELPGGLRLPVSDDLREFGRLVRSVVGLKLSEDGAASVIAAAFDARTTETDSPWQLLEQFESPGALAGMMASLLPDLKERTDYFLRVESELRNMATQAEEASA